MTRSELAEKLYDIATELCGEQFNAWADEDGDFCFSTMIAGVPVGLIVERLGDEESVLVGHHIIGARVENKEAAAEFVARRNQRLRIGRVELIEDSVVFFHHVFGAGVNTDTVRLLLGLLVCESRSHADLASTTGALKLTDLAAIDQLEEM